MIEFVAALLFEDLDTLFKKIKWPTLPRQGENFELIPGEGLESVEKIDHYHGDTGPEIHVIFNINSKDYLKYKNSGWETW